MTAVRIAIPPKITPSNKVSCEYVGPDKLKIRAAHGAFENECVYFIQGLGKNAKFSAAETVETLELAYRNLHVKRFYAQAKEHLLRQLFKVSARRLSRLSHVHAGLTVGLTILTISANRWWLGVGDSVMIYSLCKEQLTQITQKSEGQKKWVDSNWKEGDMQYYQGLLTVPQLFVVLPKGTARVLKKKQLT